ncbi:MAG: DUF5107 domain-containing protein [Chryseolinea sp.]
MSRFSLVITVIIFCFTTVHAQQKAVVRELKQSFMTYPFSDPDPVARPGRLYPYFRFDGYTTISKPQDWKIVEMENDYIKIAITPEIGGKVWSAYEKSKDFPFIFSNHVVKFRDIAMRGAWTSGGMEFNFGDIGHAPTTSTPVDYIVRNNADGSVTCFIGATDWSARTTWRVEISIHPDKAYFMTRSWWYNNSPLETSYYNWTNTGFKTIGNLEYVFPGTHFIGHVGEFETFPTDTIGRNLSYYDKGTFGSFKSYHVLGKMTDFYGGYWHDLNMGVGHYAPYQEKIGKKAWSWGLSREGLVWDKLLTDTDGPNVELQSGRLFNQASPGSMFTPFKHVSFAPYTTDQWSEYWYPVKNTRGLTQGSLKGALNIRAENSWLKFDWMALASQSDTLAIASKDGVLYKHRLQLKPMESFRDSLSWKGNAEDITVRIGDDLFLSEDNKPLSRPLTAPDHFDWDSEYGLQIRGEDLANQKNYVKAEEFLNQALEKNSNLIPALTQLAQIRYREGEYEQAKTLAGRALSVNTYDPRANYVWGLSNMEIGHAADALDGFAVASLSPAYRSAALMKMASINVCQRNWKKAEHLIASSLDADGHNNDASNLLAITLRYSGQKEKGIAWATAQLEKDPLDHYARLEKYLLNRLDRDKQDFVSLIRQEMPHETFLEIGIHYYKLNLLNDALAVLSLSPKHPMVQLWQAFIFEKSGNKSKAAEALAFTRTASAGLVFPFRIETLPVLAWAKQHSAHWKFNYYEALIRWQNHQVAMAKTLFNACGTEPDFAPFYMAKAELFQDDVDVVRASLEKAYQIDPASWRPAAQVSQFYASNDQPEKALSIAQKNHLSHRTSYITGLQYAQMLIRNKQYAKGLSMLDKLEMLPAELDMNAPTLFKQANIDYALEQMSKKRWKDAIASLKKSETWPENLGAGAPYNPDNRPTQFLMAYCYDQLNNKALADVSLKYIESYENKDREHFDAANEQLTKLLKSGSKDYKDIAHQLSGVEKTRVTYYKAFDALLK